jgi:hypothetical protein
MTPRPKFHLFEEVWVIDGTETEKPCPDCGGDGRFELVKGGYVDCPTCDGAGIIEGSLMLVPIKGTVVVIAVQWGTMSFTYHIRKADRPSEWIGTTDRLIFRSLKKAHIYCAIENLKLHGGN